MLPMVFTVRVLGLNEAVPHEAAGVQVQTSPTPLFPESNPPVTMSVTVALVPTAILVGAPIVTTIPLPLPPPPQAQLPNAQSAAITIQRVPLFIATLPSLRSS